MSLRHTFLFVFRGGSMRVLKHFMATTVFLLAATLLAGASENRAKPDNEAEKGQAGYPHASDYVASPTQPAPVTHKRKTKQGKKKPTADLAREVVAIDTDETVKRALGCNQESAPKKRTSSHKKKAPHAPEEHTTAAAHTTTSIDAEDALKRLVDGNKRYLAGKNSAGHRTAQRRSEVAKGQHPFAVIVGCSDSRVPPEILFDQGIGDLFVVRSAGNVIDDIALGSIEYAVEHLGVQLVLVLGHERCGAVDATLKGGEIGGKLKSVVDAIKPAVDKAKAKGQTSPGCDLLCSSVKSNARMVAEKIRKASPVLTESIENGKLRVAGAYYELDSGTVSLTYIPVL